MTTRRSRGVVMGVWAAFFVYLIVSGTSTRFIGPRTSWVVPFGAVSMAIAAVASFVVPGGPERVGRREFVGAFVMLLPIIVVVAVPNAGLGALAASRKSAGAGLATSSSILPPEDPDHVISFADIEWASESPSYAVAAGIAEGLELDLTGFVTHPSGGAGRFSLTRFYIACCAADAVPYSVPIEAGADQPDDRWLRIKGTLEDHAGVYVLVPEVMDPVERPKDPYLY